MAKSTKQSSSNLIYLPWLLTIVVTILAILVWGNSYRWQLSHASSYQFFPLLGLIGFSIMWSHYMAGFMRDTFLRRANLRLYFTYTGYIVLCMIVLHPGILIYQRFRDGYGLPPRSYESYVAPGMGWLTLLGSVSLLIFLAFELHRFYRTKNWWKYVTYLGDIAMIAVFYHGLRLGTQLQSGWYRWVWLFFGITLLLRIATKYYQRARTNTLL